MGTPRNTPAPHITPQRAGRLCRLLSLLGTGPQTRDAILKKLRVDLRGFYRDLELLRGRGVSVTVEGTRYHLAGDPDTALARLPMPDPMLNLRDALVLSRGTTDAHRRFRQRLDALLGDRSAPADTRRPVKADPAVY
jgi:hypothetical protein